MNYGQFLKELYMGIFGTTQFLGINIGFWLSITLILVIVIAMNLVFWKLKAPNTSSNE